MRGKHEGCQEFIHFCRITPADAGKTNTAGSKQHRGEDHPRGCGENIYDAFLLRVGRGSPPRMRGKRNTNNVSAVFDRITPADAGKTFRSKFSPREIQDHPRGCGENSYSNGVLRENSGSPPRMRGKLSFTITATVPRGITPADAGKTFTFIFIYLPFQDHPRGCGENTISRVKIRFAPGSPPRMRGKPHQIPPVTSHPRITPADAGKTLEG